LDWKKFINELKDEAGTLAKDELIDLIDSAKNDSEIFIKRQGEKIEKYLKQLANGQISKANFESYIIDIKNLIELHAYKLSVAAKARVQRLADGITDLILDKLISLVY